MNGRDSDSALRRAIEQNNVEAARRAIDAGGDVDQRVPELPGSPTLLCAAAPELRLETVRTMIAASAGVNEKCELGWTALMRLAQYPLHPQENLKVVEELIRAGADVTARNKAGYSVLDYAAANASSRGAMQTREDFAAVLGIMEALIRAGAKADKKSTQEELRKARKLGRAELGR